MTYPTTRRIEAEWLERALQLARKAGLKQLASLGVEKFPENSQKTSAFWDDAVNTLSFASLSSLQEAHLMKNEEDFNELREVITKPTSVPDTIKEKELPVETVRLAQRLHDEHEKRALDSTRMETLAVAWNAAPEANGLTYWDVCKGIKAMAANAAKQAIDEYFSSIPAMQWNTSPKNIPQKPDNRRIP